MCGLFLMWSCVWRFSLELLVTLLTPCAVYRTGQDTLHCTCPPQNYENTRHQLTAACVKGWRIQVTEWHLTERWCPPWWPAWWPSSASPPPWSASGPMWPVWAARPSWSASSPALWQTTPGSTSEQWALDRERLDQGEWEGGRNYNRIWNFYVCMELVFLYLPNSLHLCCWYITSIFFCYFIFYVWLAHGSASLSRVWPRNYTQVMTTSKDEHSVKTLNTETR